MYLPNTTEYKICPTLLSISDFCSLNPVPTVVQNKDPAGSAQQAQSTLAGAGPGTWRSDRQMLVASALTLSALDSWTDVSFCGDNKLMSFLLL